MDCPQQQQRKRVRFSSQPNVVIVLENDDNNTQASRVDPRKAARDEAYTLIPKGYGQLLKGTYEDPTVDDCQDNLNAFVVGVPDMDNARGLERYMSPQHKDERDGAREDVLEAVLTRQEDLSDLTPHERGDELRQESRKASRSSRVFARRMGIADELAVRDAKQPKQCRFTTSCHSTSPKRPPRSSALDVGIRSMAACRNAKMASRQASIRKLNCSIRNLACAQQNVNNSSNHSSCSCSTVSSCSSIESFATTTTSAPVSPTNHLIHPSLIVSRRDRALKLPGRSSRQSASECAELIQSALDLVTEEGDGDNHQEQQQQDVSRPVALSA